MSKRVAAFSFGLALVSAAGCAPEVPASPTYTKDVQPILMAHCARCHGANDMLNAMEVYGRVQAPLKCYLQRYDDAGDCSAGSTTCQLGAASCAPLIVAYSVSGTVESMTRMPPPPSDPLTDWEKDVLKRWAAMSPPAR